MAKPIAPTPILTGKEAEDFIKKVNNFTLTSVTKQEVIEAKKIYEQIKDNTESTYAL